MLRNMVDYTEDPVFLCEVMDWNNPYYFHPIFGVLQISPGVVVILLGAAVIGQSICGKRVQLLACWDGKREYSSFMHWLMQSLLSQELDGRVGRGSWDQEPCCGSVIVSLAHIQVR